MKFKKLGIILRVGLIFFLVPQFSQADSSIHFQGRLTDALGRPIEGKENRVFFSIFSTEMGPNPLWENPQEQKVETNAAGLFSTDIGPIPMAVFSQTNLYLQVSVLSGGLRRVLSPRQKLNSVPFAIRADFATAADVADNAVTSEKIKDGEVKTNDVSNRSITAVKLSTDVAASLIPSGAILMFAHNCPSGWTRFANLDNRFPLGVENYAGIPLGSSTPNITMTPAGNHVHDFPNHIHQLASDDVLTGGRLPTTQVYSDRGRNFPMGTGLAPAGPNEIAIRVLAKTDPGGGGQSGSPSGSTIDPNGNHLHQIQISEPWLPPSWGVVFCEKD